MISMMGFVGFWLVLAIVFTVVELATVGLVSIWFAAGSAAALFVAVCHGNIVLQVVVFIECPLCFLWRQDHWQTSI